MGVIQSTLVWKCTVCFLCIKLVTTKHAPKFWLLPIQSTLIYNSKAQKGFNQKQQERHQGRWEKCDASCGGWDRDLLCVLHIAFLFLWCSNCTGWATLITCLCLFLSHSLNHYLNHLFVVFNCPFRLLSFAFLHICTNYPPGAPTVYTLWDNLIWREQPSTLLPSWLKEQVKKFVCVCFFAIIGNETAKWWAHSCAVSVCACTQNLIDWWRKGCKPVQS